MNTQIKAMIIDDWDGGGEMSELIRIQVLLSKTEADRFDDYCHARGFKKSTLIARLVREHLAREEHHTQLGLPVSPSSALGEDRS